MCFSDKNDILLKEINMSEQVSMSTAHPTPESESYRRTTEVFDHIVVGGGSAGCTVAARLVQAGRRVLLLEAGPPDNNPFVHVPGTFIRVLGTQRTWDYSAEPEAGVNHRRMYIPQGRTLGGGSSVNAMIYIRGQAADYDDWRDMGCPGWAWRDVLPYFIRSEGNQRLGAPLHGQSGPLSVGDGTHRHPLSRAFVESAMAAGLPYSDDFNGLTQAGVGYYQTTIAKGRRASTAATYLRLVRKHAGLKVVTGAAVERLLFEGRQVRGVEVRLDDGSRMRWSCGGDVVLCAGALASPVVLMRSGVGPSAHLQQLGITPVAELAGVGRNFQDHLNVSAYARTRDPISLVGHDRGLKALRHGLQYLLTRGGLLSSNVIESGGFVDTSASGRPDIQFHVVPILLGDVDRAPIPGHGISVNTCPLRPRSRGVLRLRSPDPKESAVLEAGFFSHPDDMRIALNGVRLSRRILRCGPLAEMTSGMLGLPEKDADAEPLLEAYVRNMAKTVYHPSGTCRMGQDEHAVVSPRLDVHGVGNLRVADASVMPSLVSGNTNAPTVMIAERCADFVLGRA